MTVRFHADRVDDGVRPAAIDQIDQRGRSVVQRVRAAGFLRDDPAGVAALWETVSRLAGEPRPPESFAYGSPDLRHLRAGRYRVFYTIVNSGA